MTYTFVCPVCMKKFRYDEPGEPCCTGHSEMRDDHPMEVMRLLKIEKTEIAPSFAEARAVGQLIMPHMECKIAREAKIILGRG